MTETDHSDSPAHSDAEHGTIASQETSTSVGAIAEEMAAPAAPSTPSGHDDQTTTTTIPPVKKADEEEHAFIDPSTVSNASQ